MIGFFQCFSTAPKPHFTLKLSVVRVWAINLSRIWIWRGRSRGKPQRIVQMIVGITISNSQWKYLEFSLWKHSLQYVDNEGINNMGEDMAEHIWQNNKIECFALPANYSQKSAVMTLHIPVMCSIRAYFTG